MPLIALAASVFVLLLATALLLTVIPRLGAGGRRVADFLCRTPGLDLLVSLFTWLPWVAGGLIAGWRGLAVVIPAQVLALTAWTLIHEFIFRTEPGARAIVKFLNRTVGRFNNHAALWVTAIALPGFLFIRFLEITCYPMLVWLLKFPRYRQAEWVNCSRQKFQGLVGHDLIWCLYCDWMTGVYALGAEMLRNVESFWCPIRFRDGKKCDNCKLDFPDIAHGWVPADGTMADVEGVMTRMYADGRREWFNHPARLTVKGKDV